MTTHRYILVEVNDPEDRDEWDNAVQSVLENGMWRDPPPVFRAFDVTQWVKSSDIGHGQVKRYLNSPFLEEL